MNECFNHRAVHSRLNRVIGQLNAIKRMLDDEKSKCEDIMVQINAADSALHRIGLVILEGHLGHCVRAGIEEGRADAVIESFKDALEQFVSIK